MNYSNVENKNVFLFFSAKPHANKSRLIKFYLATKKTIKVNFDFYIITYDNTSITKSINIEIEKFKFNQKIYGVDLKEKLNYPIKGNTYPFKLKPGNCDLPIIAFWKDHPDYARYWIMEDDVDYSGNPTNMLDELSEINADLMATHLTKFFPKWDYSSIFKSANKDIHYQDRWLCFLPFHVIKSTALQTINDVYAQGWDGHHEMTWPTALIAHNQTVIDIGGRGPYVNSEMRDKYYHGLENDAYRKNGSFGTLTIRLRPGHTKNILWHPVKPFMAWYPQIIKRMISYAKWIIKRLLK